MSMPRRVGLARGSGPPKPLLKSIGGKPTSALPEMKSPKNSSASDSESSLSECSQTPSTPSSYARSQSPTDITAQPKSDSESSDDPRDRETAQDSRELWKTTKKRRGIDKESLSGTSSDESTSRKKQKVERQVEPFRQPPDMDMFLSVSRKPSIKYGSSKGYGKTKNIHGTAKPETPTKTKNGSAFKVPPNPTPSSPRNRFKKPIGGDEGKAPAKKEVPAFKLPPDEPSSSLQTAATDLSDAVFDQPEKSASRASSPASSPPDALSPEVEDEKPARCPMCEKPVDRQLLKDFQLSKRTQVRDQHRFCDEHQKRDAKDEWKQCGYPELDWDSLESRCKQFFGDLERIVVGKKDSHFLDMLQEAQDEGKASLKRYLGTGSLSMVPTGYYGARGSRLMIEALSPHFHPLIREFVSSVSKSTKSRNSTPPSEAESKSRSTTPTSDRKASQARLLKAAGSQAFIQVVLVPELCMRLIRQDMRLEPKKNKKSKGKGEAKSDEDGLTKARTIMFDSEKLGNILHQEEGDKLNRRETQEDEDLGWDVDD